MDFTKTVLGIELGSTRIKAVLLDEKHLPIASGGFEWENQLVDGIWTYDMDTVHTGIRACYADLKRDIAEKFGCVPETFGAIGVSGMMHGYLPFDKDGKQLAAFRTWRNTITGQAAEELTELFGFAIPQRWSIAHLYQAILNGEGHVKDIAFLTTLAGYIHTLLTGEKVMGIGEASGMFPIDSVKNDYNQGMVEKFDVLAETKGMPWKLREILPKVLVAGEVAGKLTAEGAAFLDPAGDLKPGVPFAPCEGDAGTGMVATNSVRERTGNVSAGTSDFAMIVADHELGMHREINMVTTPAGKPVAMVHCANCTSDINAWVNLLIEFAEMLGVEVNKGELFTKLFYKALEGDPDCGGLLSYNYFSGEGVTALDEGRPIFARLPGCNFTLANFMRTHLLSALSTLKIGLDILRTEENIPVDKILGHGGFFKTPGVGQRMLSAAVSAPVSVMETAGEGGPYGMALLAAYMLWKDAGETLEDYLDNKVFADTASSTLMADEIEIAGFDAFLERYKNAFDVERTAVKTLK
ncbi:MAG: FGGY-family carbohydrate kinase [Oscillospiraceae bacterium]|nr:FGGY-family carbohydrate kinase [Oscillospiraceae bacterium]